MSARAAKAHSPSWTEVFIGAALSVVIGALLGAAYLVLQPVVTLKGPPKEGEVKRGAITYQPGGLGGYSSRDLAVKQQSLARGGSVSLTEGDVNAIVAPAAARAAKSADAAGGVVKAGAPNFRIHDGRLQIGVPLELNVLGFERTVIAQVRGTFVRQGDHFALDPAEFYLGGCALHRLPVVGALVYRRMLAAAAIPPEAAATWARLSDVTVEGTTLRLTMP